MHKQPHESVEAFLARVRASAFIIDVDVPRNKRGEGRKSKVLKMAANLTGDQLVTLLDLAYGRAVRIDVDGETYAYWNSGHMRGMGPVDVKHTVSLTECSCKSFQFRGVECKHIRALKEFLG